MTSTDNFDTYGQTQSTFPMSLRWHVRCSSGAATCTDYPHDPCAAWRVCSVAHPGPPGVDGAPTAREFAAGAREQNPPLSKRRESSRRGAERTSRWVACCRASRSTDSTPGTSTAARSISAASVVQPDDRLLPKDQWTEPQRRPCRWWTWPTSSGLERKDGAEAAARRLEATRLESSPGRAIVLPARRERGLGRRPSIRGARGVARGLAPGRGTLPRRHWSHSGDVPGARRGRAARAGRWRPRSCRLPWRPARCFPARAWTPTFELGQLDFDPRPEPPLSDFEKRLADVPAVLRGRADDARSRAARVAQRLTLATIDRRVFR